MFVQVNENARLAQRALQRLLGRAQRRMLRRVRDDRAVASIEFAFILPFMLILLLGSAEMFLMSMASRKMTRVTNTVGDLIAQARGTLMKSDINGYYAAAKHIMGKFPTDRLALSVFTYTWDMRSRRVKLAWRHHLGSYTCQSKAPSLTREQRQAMQDGNDLVITYGCYRYTVQVGRFVLGNRTFNMTDEVTLRPRQRLRLQCANCSS